MKDELDNSPEEIRETDIVFDCPHCGKSLAIDYRGAGLTIECSDCGREVEVPIPEGMQITDIDSSEEEQEIRILNLRRLLVEKEYRIRQLENQLAEAMARIGSEGQTSEVISESVLAHVKIMEACIARQAESLASIERLFQKEP